MKRKPTQNSPVKPSQDREVDSADPKPLPAKPEPQGGPIVRSPLNGAVIPPSMLFQPGQSGNPGGAPKGTRLTTYLAYYGEKPARLLPVPGSDEYEDLPMNAQIAIAQLLRARDQADGLPAAAWAADRVEGGVDRTVHLTHKQESTMTPEQVAQELKNAGLTGPGEIAKLEDF